MRLKIEEQEKDAVDHRLHADANTFFFTVVFGIEIEHVVVGQWFSDCG